MNGTHEFVYVIAMDAGHHKIGISGRPESRLAQMQTSHPWALQLIFVLKTNRAATVEKAAHNILYRSRLLGEWFGVGADAAIAAVLKADRRYPPRLVAPKPDPFEAYEAQWLARWEARQLRLAQKGALPPDGIPG